MDDDDTTLDTGARLLDYATRIVRVTLKMGRSYPQQRVAKELRGSHRLLELIRSAPLVEKPEIFNPLIDETDQIERIFNASIQTVQKRKQN